MKIEIWSDTACPFCYIGLKKLQGELNKFKHKDDIELVWHSYELNDSLPEKASSKSYIESMVDMQGVSTKDIRGKLASIIGAGEVVGIKFDFDKIVQANTSKALRLVKLAKEYNKATEAEETLFKAYFEQGKDVSDNQTLVQLAKEIGLPSDKVEEMLASDKYAKEVKDETSHANDVMDLNYIPYFVFNNEHVVQGAIDASEYAKLLHTSHKEWTERGVSNNKQDTISGQSCSIDGVCS